MIHIRHSGIYVDDIEKEERFYREVFRMHPICSVQEDRGALYDELFDMREAIVVTTKLITPYGKESGQGDMLELVKVLFPTEGFPRLPAQYPILMTGIGHIAFGVIDMEGIVSELEHRGGSRQTKIHRMSSGNLCCFCRDPEGNWLELIENRKEEHAMDNFNGKIALVTGGTSGIGGV